MGPDIISKLLCRNWRATGIDLAGRLWLACTLALYPGVNGEIGGVLGLDP